MANTMWGLLGPEVIGRERRTRTLGLGTSVRAFNELAVPGIGGTWFGKQIFLAILGVAVAEKARSAGKKVQNIETANAIEALACLLAFVKNGWKGDSRLLGITKMSGNAAKDIRFEAFRKPNFYVTQPMRMATVQALPSLGLVATKGIRFNSFTCAQAGQDLIEAQTGDYGKIHYNRGVLDYLVAWVLGEPLNVAGNDKLFKALSPLEPMTKAGREVLRERLIQGGEQEELSDKTRRRSALDWVDALRSPPRQTLDWDVMPSFITAVHWADLRTGALLFAARDAAIEVLDQLERQIAKRPELRHSLDDPLDGPVVTALQGLRTAASDFLDRGHSDQVANDFCQECADSRDSMLLAKLVGRDERVLRLRGRLVVPGTAFHYGSSEESNDLPGGDQTTQATASQMPLFPEGISSRVSNLFYLNSDLRSELDQWLKLPQAVPATEAH